VVDLVEMRTVTFDGDKGEEVVSEPGVPENLRALAAQKRLELIERVAEVELITAPPPSPLFLSECNAG
jgi:elongation factor G